MAVTMWTLAAALTMCLLAHPALDAATAKKKPTHKKAALPRAPAARPPVVSATTALESPAALVPFFERLYRLKTQPEAGLVRILHYGDSHTAADEWTGMLRMQFQMRFGEGGGGFSHAGQPFRGYRRLGQKSSMSKGWRSGGLLTREGDGFNGMSGISIETSQAGETISLDADCQATEIFYLKQPGGGSMRIVEDGAVVETVATDGELGAGYFRFDAASPGVSRRHFEIETLDDAPVRLFGWVTENERGVTYETLGINGAQADLSSRWNEDLLQSQIARRDPALIVLAYGTNEASNRDWNRSNYREAFSALIQRFRRIAPMASILVIGPPDRLHRVRRRWQPFDKMDSIVAAQREAAMENGCAFWDVRARMGGAGAMRKWVAARYAQRDHVHFTGPGYQLLGEIVSRDILGQYDEFARLRERIFQSSNSNGQTSDHR